ncbi:MAG: D-alanyl-D-alanine carboxypeptidase [Alphaproteobacteria bacterium]|nr:D-alanyl-D-alanine carboxypeptidase [Alphaproteobacteria bacterium]
MVVSLPVNLRPAIALAAVLAVVSALPLEAAAQQRARQPAPAPAAQQPAAKPAPAPPANPLQPESSARQVIIADASTGTVLYEKNADERMPPSSMSKIMTAYMVFDALKRGDLKLDDTLPVSERAWRMQGSKMFVPLGDRVKVDDLLRGMIIQSGNDACIVLAEGLAGSEEAFAERMNATARRIGLTGSNFRNSSGWPDPDHYMTARDLMTLSQRLIADFPEYYRYYSERDFTYGKDEKGTPIKQGNRNPLLYKNTGADGIKTGHTEQAGYGLTASAVRENRRVVMVVNGWQSMRARAEESERLLEWAYREFGTYVVFKAGQPVEKADVWLGKEPNVALTSPQDIAVTIPRRLRQQIDARVVFDAPVPAPIEQGQRIGSVIVTVPERPAAEFPLYASAPVEKLGFGGRVAATFSHYVFGRK